MNFKNIWDKTSNYLDQADVEFTEWADDTFRKLRENRAKGKQETIMKINNKSFGVASITSIRKDINGLFYISPLYNETAERFTFENLQFSGSKTTQHTKTKGKLKGRSGSALVGGAILGPVGAIAGGSRKRKLNSVSVTETKDAPGKGTIFLRSVTSNTIKTVKFTATQAKFLNIKRFFDAN